MFDTTVFASVCQRKYGFALDAKIPFTYTITSYTENNLLVSDSVANSEYI